MAGSKAFAGVLAVTVAVACGACGTYWNAFRSPIEVKETARVPPVHPGRAIVAQDYSIEAKSSLTSFASGRNNLTLTASLGRVEPNEVQLLVLLASTTLGNVDPRNFYVRLASGDKRVLADEIVLGEVRNVPYDYTVKTPVKYVAGEVEFSDGGKAKIIRTKLVDRAQREDYYVRSARLIFRADGLVPDTPERLALELRDLGIDMEVVWLLGREGGES